VFVRVIVSIELVSIELVSIELVSIELVSIELVSIELVSIELVSIELVSMELVSIELVSIELGQTVRMLDVFRERTDFRDGSWSDKHSWSSATFHCRRGRATWADVGDRDSAHANISSLS
jgi:hypothetical protein